mmetsp:Transcript_25701/g.45756  ORF Transcript_25701/g.45756 Transcript_25701/m.45756 type:complete len:265 (-) Transcript_25701:466-1260(-)
MEVVNAKLDVAERFVSAQCRCRRLITSKQRWHQPACVEVASGMNPGVYCVGGCSHDEHGCKLVYEFERYIGATQNPQRAGHLPPLHQMLDDSLVVVMHGRKMQQLVQPTVTGQQGAGGGLIQHITVLGEKRAELVDEPLALGPAFALIIKQRPINLIQLQLCQPSRHHRRLRSVISRQRLELADEELMQRRRVADVHEPQRHLFKGRLHGIQPRKQARSLHVVCIVERCLCLLCPHDVLLIHGIAVRRCLLVFRPGEVDPPHVA